MGSTGKGFMSISGGSIGFQIDSEPDIFFVLPMCKDCLVRIPCLDIDEDHREKLWCTITKPCPRALTRAKFVIKNVSKFESKYEDSETIEIMKYLPDEYKKT